MWDPAAYRRFGDERSRPFLDLLARVPAEHPRAVVDLGCGPGDLTAMLAGRWPGARVTGLDSSPEMIQEAARLATPVAFHAADLRDWRPEPDVDVLISNAALQWVPEHRSLLTRWAGQLPAGAWLAGQLPGNFAAPSHRLLRELADEPRWRARVAPVLREQPVDDAAGYATLLLDAGCAVDAWESTYVHLLPTAPATGPVDAAPGPSGAEATEPGTAAPHPVLRWMEGTALRPVRAALAGDPPAWAAFRAALGERS